MNGQTCHNVAVSGPKKEDSEMGKRPFRTWVAMKLSASSARLTRTMTRTKGQSRESSCSQLKVQPG